MASLSLTLCLDFRDLRITFFFLAVHFRFAFALYELGILVIAQFIVFFTYKVFIYLFILNLFIGGLIHYFKILLAYV